MFALLLQRAAFLIGADYRPRDCTQPMRSWKSYISQDQGPIIIGTIPITCSDHVLRSRAPIEPIANDIICVLYIIHTVVCVWNTIHTIIGLTYTRMELVIREMPIHLFVIK